jgi:hypothetical protein
MNQKKWAGVARMAQGKYGYWNDPMEAQGSSQNLIYFLNCFVPKNFGIQTHHCILL